MSCSSEEISSSSRSGKSTREAQPVGGALRRDRVQPEALGRGVPDRRALEEVEGLGGADQRLDAGGRRAPRSPAGTLRILPRAVGALVREAHDRDHERHVGLDRGDHVADRGLVLADQAQHALARLGERGERLERLERSRQPTAVALVVLLGSWKALRRAADRSTAASDCAALRHRASLRCCLTSADARIGKVPRS